MYYLSFQKGFQKVISNVTNYKLIIGIHALFIVSFDWLSLSDYFKPIKTNIPLWLQGLAREELVFDYIRGRPDRSGLI